MIKINGFTGEFTGLTYDEVKILQKEYGKNELMPEKKETFFSKALEVFKEPMFILLFCTALIYFLLREYRDGIIMLCFVTFMSGINLFQEWRTDKTIKALKDLSAPRVRVIRNDALESIDSKELTVGDLMLIEEGEKIAADGKIVEMYDLGIDESSLTGESQTVWKKTEDESDNHWRRDFCYAGTTMIQGRAIVKVTSVGQYTEYGKIGTEIILAPDRPTPLEKETRRLVKICALIGLLLFLLVLLATYLNSQNIINSILAGITLAMAIIPEEFPVILTVFLAMGAWRLAKKNTLIRRMSSVETLGAVSVLCVDKTGTLTKNKMTVQEIVKFKDIEDNELLYWGVLGCETEPFEPMEKAILEHAKGIGLDSDDILQKPLIHEYPFSTDTKMMGHIWEIDGLNCLVAKGSPESIFPLCSLDSDALSDIEREQDLLAEKGYRVIAVAIKKDVKEVFNDLKENKLDFIGLIALMDPPREAVPDAVKVCAGAGIRVVMITGDNGTTAKSIAQKIGIQNSNNVITGEELDNMSDDELYKKVKVTNIFARVIPSHKTRIVKALRDIGEIVAMTGDGVNDAPALKYADIGIAMGGRGTGVAKEAADMILLDDNFTTIVDTIKDGRRIYDNIKKAIGYVFVIHIPIALMALMTPLLRLPLFLYPIHVVLMELIVDPTCSIIFERQPAEPDIMERKPRSKKESFVSKRLMIKALLQGFVMFFAIFGAYYYFLFNSADSDAETAARTIALLTFVLSNLFLVYVNQSSKEFAIFSMIKYRDKVRWSVNFAVIIGMAFLIYTPYGNAIAKTHPLELNEVLISLGLAVIATFWWEIVKFLKRIFKIYI